MKLLKVKLEFTKEDKEHNEIFYRYRIGKYQMWFTQHQDNGESGYHQNCIGCIFQVSIHRIKEDKNLFKLYIDDCLGINRGYPNDYRYEHRDYCTYLSDIENHIKNEKYAQKVLATAKHFFENSFHYELFKKRENLKKLKGEV